MEVPEQLDTTVQTGPSQAATKMKICPKCGMERLPTTNVCPADGTVLRDNVPSADNPLSTLSETYEFLGETGRGGMAVIYKAKNRKTGRVVAIKKMLASTLTETAFMRFQQEAKAITTLRHPNIILVHEFGVAEDGEPFMVMDFIEGSNLGELIKEKGALSVEESMHRFIQLCDALQHAHAAGVLHRDLKPGNVMLSSADGSFADARLVDFGIAKLMAKDGEEAEKLTMTGQLFGSPPYMSPEQCRGFELDARTDIYSMGCVMFETLTGRVPIRGQSVLETIMMQVSEPAPSMKEVCPDKDFPPILETIIAKSLAKDAADRYQTMRELMVALMEAGIEMRSPGTIRTVIQKVQKPPLVPPWVYISVICFLLFTSMIVGTAREDSLKKKSMALKQSEQERLNLLQWTPAKKIQDSMFASWLTTDLNCEKLDISGSSLLTDKAMLAVTKLKNLRILILSDTNIGDDGMKPLVELQKLHRLDLKRTKVSDEGLKPLLQLKELYVLGLVQSQVSNEGMATIAKMRQLNNLAISYIPRVNGSGVEKLKDLHLNFLFMAGIVLKDCLQSLSQMHSLRTLDLKGSDLSDSKMEDLKEMVQLTNLNMVGTRVTTTGMKHLANLRLLENLYIGKLDIEDPAIDALVNLEHLVELDLGSTKITDAGVVKLANIKSLRNLSLISTLTGDKGVAALATLPNLEKLDLSGTEISDESLKKLRFCKTLKFLTISYCPRITRAQVVKLDREFNKLDEIENKLEEANSGELVKRALTIEYNND